MLLPYEIRLLIIEFMLRHTIQMIEKYKVFHRRIWISEENRYAHNIYYDLVVRSKNVGS